VNASCNVITNAVAGRFLRWH